MTTIQLMACIGMVVGFFVLLGIIPSDFTEGVFRQITSKPKSLRDEINESTQRKKKFVLRREIEESQNILRMTGREAKFPAICAMSLLLFLVGASFAFLLGNFFLVPVLAAGMMFIPFWYIKLLSDVVRGLIGVLRGDDGVHYFQMLAHDMKQLELQRLKAKAMKIPPKIRVFSFILLMCFLVTYLAIIIFQILNSLSGMF